MIMSPPFPRLNHPAEALLGQEANGGFELAPAFGGLDGGCGAADRQLASGLRK